MKFINDLRLLFLGIWLGAVLSFVATAQTAFSVLPQRELAGAVVGRSLTVVNLSGIAIALLVLALSLLTARNSGRMFTWLDRSFLVLTASACAIGQFVIGFFIASVRTQMGGRPIDEFAIDDPLRVQFNTLHEYSVWLLIAAFVFALISFFLIANRRDRAADKSPIDPYNFEKEFKI